MYLNYYGCVLLHSMSNVYQLNWKMMNVCSKQKRDVCLEYSNTIIKNKKMKKKLTMLLTLILYLTDTACTYNLY